MMKIRMKNDHTNIREAVSTNMTIRMKTDPTQVHEAKPVEQQIGGYIIRSGWKDPDDVDGTIIRFSQQDWEPVPEERWVNVTKQCETIQWKDGQSTVYHDNCVVAHTPTVYYYRLRKVDLHSLNASDELSSVVSAFLVEKKV